jgi:hypothetical protein
MGSMCARCRDVDRVGAEAWNKGRELGQRVEGREPWTMEEAGRFYQETLESAASVWPRSMLRS